MIMANGMARGGHARYVRTSHYMKFLYEAIFAQLLANGVREVALVF